MLGPMLLGLRFSHWVPRLLSCPLNDQGVEDMTS